MNQAGHSRVRKVFLELVDLPAQERRAYLDEACDGEDEVRDEVESLLAHHMPESILTNEKGAKEPLEAARGSRGTFITTGPATYFSTRPARLIWTLAAAVVLVTLGLFVRSTAQRSMLAIRGGELTTLLDAGVQALELWIEDQKVATQFLGDDPRLVRSVQELLAAGESAENKIEAWIRSPARQRLLETDRLFWITAGSTGFVVIDERGQLAFTPNPHETGLVLDEGLSRELTAALRGQTVFVHPHRYRDLVERESGGTMYSFVLGPVRDGDGRVIAAVANMQKAFGAGSLSAVLEVSRLGKTGETYAFDAEGLLLSESRFVEELRRTGQVPASAEEGREWEAGGQLNLQIRDPGGDLDRGHLPELEVGARPLTKLAALAVAARDKSDPDDLRGVVLEPYRNYRGVEVIGAWRWLAEHGFAVASEIEVGEALVPFRYVERILEGLFVLLIAVVAAALWSTFSAARLRRRVRQLKELGPYRLRSRLGEGGMGVVYLAEHALLKRRTAVKVLSGELSNQNVVRFEREVSLASRLTHPNTIEIYDYGETPEGVFYYAMEYVDGPTLAELVTRFGPLPPERVVSILRQVCGSLGEAHREGLIHRDIKPQNIMLCVRGGHHGVVKVLDFGLVKDVTNEGFDELSRGFQIGGTPLYMAPERVTSPRTADSRVDIYSLGCVAYYLLSGRPVFEPTSELGLLDAVVNATPRRLSEVMTQAVPRDLEELVMDCLAKDPDNRPATVFAVMDRIDALSGVAPWTQEEAARWWRDVYCRARAS